MLRVSLSFYLFCDVNSLNRYIVKHFNFSWRDMTIPTANMMLNVTRIGLAEIEAHGKVNKVD